MTKKVKKQKQGGLAWQFGRFQKMFLCRCKRYDIGFV